MSIQADAGTTPATRAAAPATVTRTRPFAWSVRREIWENRSIWIAPLAAAGFVLFGFALGVLRMSHTLKEIAKAPPDAQLAFRMLPYGIAGIAILGASIVVAVFYCLGTLYNERRDRSILFWKSMPVSDLTTLLAKIIVPLVVLPLISIVVICATQLVMLGLNALGWAANGRDVASLWTTVPLPGLWAFVVYVTVTVTLWYAPLYAWLLVLSAWARRAPFLWAILPPLAIIVVEKLAFDTNWFFNLVSYRLRGGFGAAFTELPHRHGHFQLPMPDPVKYFSTPGLWAGLAVAAALFALAVWLRRRREPM
jgi:ABC-2 type transport system permease protein